MEKPQTEQLATGDLPEAVVVAKTSVSYIWIIPLVAVFIAAWLAYKSVSEQGPMVTITFQHAEGIEAGKTKIRYKDVEIGVVQQVELTSDLSRVVVTAQFVKGADRYLKQETRFWIVKARLKAGEVSGLDTLFSGIYIGVDPAINGETTYNFEALDKPPVVTSEQNGRNFILRAQSLGSVDIGTPVYFRQIDVGQVVGYQLSEDKQHIDIQVFVYAPFHNLVTTSSRFWEESGVDVSMDTSGFRVDSESVMTMLLGGISFETPVSLDKAEAAQENTVFEFYENRQATQVKRYAAKSYYMLYFDESVRGLAPGASVEFRGMQIGRVVDVRIEFDKDHLEVRIPVLIEVEPERFNIVAQNKKDRKITLEDSYNVFESMVAKGLRAKLKNANLLTGKLLVDMDFYQNVPVAAIQKNGDYPVFPTIATEFGEITAGLAKMIGKVNALPLETITENVVQITAKINMLMSDPELGKTVTHLNELLLSIKKNSTDINTQSIPALNESFIKAQETLASIQRLAGPDGPAGRELNRLIIDFTEAARAVREMAEYLERHPESVLYGKEK